MGAQQQKETNNTYTQTEVDLKLQLQQEKVEALQQAINQQKEQIKESIDRQEKYIQSKDKKTDWLLAFMNFWIMFISVVAIVLGYWLMRKTEKSEEKVETELKKIERLKGIIEKLEQEACTHVKFIEDKRGEASELLKERIEKIEQEVEVLIESIKDKRDEASELVESIKKERPENMPPEEKQKVEKQIKKTKGTKTEAEYTFDDWFLKAFNAQTENKFEEACSFYEKAIEAKAIPEDLAIAYNNWGNALGKLGKKREDEKLLEQSIEKYKKAIKIKTDYALAYVNWGNVLDELGRIKGDISLHKEKIESLLLKADAIEKGQGNYNLACLYSLLGNKNKAIKWIEKSLLYEPNTSREFIENDDDFANIKNTPEFKSLLDKYFPQ